MTHLLLAVIYVAFVSLGLPDSLLGAAWPSISGDFSVPVSWAGGISMIIAAGTVVSSLQSDRLTRRLGTGKVTAGSVLVTAAALFGFSVSGSYWELCLWAAPYGLGAGCIDAALNNYVALHYASRHMSWLHCMWGVGASLGPYVMGAALSGGQSWNTGYRIISAVQIALTAVLLASLPLWRRTGPERPSPAQRRPLSLREVLNIPGVKAVMAAFFCYSAVEQTAGLWASSYLTLERGVSPAAAAGFASLFFTGITVGRALSGFLTWRLNDRQMIRLGEGILLVGGALLLLPLGRTAALAGLALIGLGCAPVYPSLIHAAPEYFGAARSQAVIGVQMAAAYTGTCLMPPAFGLLAEHAGTALLPLFLLLFTLLMAAMHESLLRRTEHGERCKIPGAQHGC